MKATPRAIFVLCLPVFLLYGCERGAWVSGTDGAAAAENIAPVAIITSATAGVTDGSTLALGSAVTLTGTTSVDADGDTLTYAWTLTTQPTGSTITENSSGVSVSFSLDVAGTYTYELVVNDGTVDSTAVTFTLTAGADTNAAPVAAIATTTPGVTDGSTVIAGTTVTLDGSASDDADGDTLTYAWSAVTQPVGSTIDLSTENGITVPVTLDIIGAYTFRLMVNDGTVDSAPDTFSLTADTAPNGAPTAVITTVPVLTDGSVVAPNTSVTLAGSTSSDPDGDTLTYAWSVTSQPAASTIDLSAQTGATVPVILEEAGTYSFQLVVNDGTVDSTPVTLTLIADTAPVAVISNSVVSFLLGATVTLDGSTSSDADGDTLTYHWSVTAQPVGAVLDLSAQTATLPVLLPLLGTYTFQLVVNDGTLDSSPVTFTLDVL